MDATDNRHVGDQEAKQKENTLDDIIMESLTKEPRFDRTLTGFRQRRRSKGVQVTFCPPGLLDQWWPGMGLCSLQSLARREHPG